LDPSYNHVELINHEEEEVAHHMFDNYGRSVFIFIFICNSWLRL